MAEQVAAQLKVAAHVNRWLDGEIDGRELVVDVLTDLRHFARTHAVDWDGAVDSSMLNYLAELVDERFPCEGHPAGPFDQLGETVYCDGSCRRGQTTGSHTTERTDQP